jgi:putative addiction module CopG family antidote
MTRQLAHEHEARIKRMLDSGSFTDVDQVIGEALDLLEERERRLQALRAKLQVGFDSGEGIEYTPELMDEIEREAEEAYRRGEKPSPDVCP